MTFTGSIFTKLTTTQQMSEVTFCTEFPPKQMKNAYRTKFHIRPYVHCTSFLETKKLLNASNMGISTKFIEIGQETHKVRIEAHARPYVMNYSHWVDFHGTQVFQTPCEERNFTGDKIFAKHLKQFVRSMSGMYYVQYKYVSHGKSSPLRLRTELGRLKT